MNKRKCKANRSIYAHVFMHIVIHPTQVATEKLKKEAASETMSDFFGDLHGGSGGIRKPEVVMNDGPLPPMSGLGGAAYPAGFNGIPDGRIDYASSLLGNINPYSYGEADRLSTQTAYLNIPHRVQRIVPTLSLPEAQTWDTGGSFFRLSHQVDDGDIAFVIRAMFSPYELVEEKKKYNRQGILYAVDPVVNLATVNYILHGLQRFGFDSKKHVGWNTLWQALGIDHHFAKRYNGKLSAILMDFEQQLLAATAANDGRKKLWIMCFIRRLRREVAEHIVKDVIRPFGVPTGSERQGGQHQGSNSAITWPVDFVTTLTIDGLVINMVNFWRHEDVNSGDDLMLYIEERNYTEYVLSHHPKNVRKQVFGRLRDWEVLRALDTLRNGNEDAGKKKRQREVNWSDNAVAMMLDRMWDFVVNEYAGEFVKAASKDVDGSVSVSTGGKILSTPISDKKDFFSFVRDLTTAAHGKHDETLAKMMMDAFDGDVANLDKFNIMADAGKEPVFQLVPGISSSASCGVRNAVWRHGYWHVARSQTMHFKYDQHLDIPNGYHAAVRGKVLQVTFAPVWMEPLEDAGMGGGGATTTGSTFAVDYQDRHDTGRSSKQQRVSGLVHFASAAGSSASSLVAPSSSRGGGGGIPVHGGSSRLKFGHGSSGSSGSRVTHFSGASSLPSAPPMSKISGGKFHFRAELVDEFEIGNIVGTAFNGDTGISLKVLEIVASLSVSGDADERLKALIEKTHSSGLTFKAQANLLLPMAVALSVVNSEKFEGFNVFQQDVSLNNIFESTVETVARDLVFNANSKKSIEDETRELELAGKNNHDSKTNLLLKFQMPSTISTVVRLAESKKEKVPLMFKKGFELQEFLDERVYKTRTAEEEYDTLSRDHTLLLARFASVCALFTRDEDIDSEKLKKEISYCFNLVPEDDTTSLQAKNLREMMDTAEYAFEGIKNDDSRMWGLLGAYIGACIGLGATSSHDIPIKETIAAYEAGEDRKTPIQTEKAKKQIIATASREMISLGIDAALALYGDILSGSLAASADKDSWYDIGTMLVQKTLLLFLQVCFHMSLRIHEHRDLSKFSLQKREGDYIMEVLKKDDYTQTNFVEDGLPFQNSYESRLVLEFPGNHIENDWGIPNADNELKKLRAEGAFQKALRICEYMKVTQEMDAADWVQSLVRETNTAFDSISDKESLQILYDSAWPGKLLTIPIEFFGALKKMPSKEFADAALQVDEKADFLRHMLFIGAVEKELVEKYVDSTITGFHADHYHKALRACMDDAMKCMGINGYDEILKVTEVLDTSGSKPNYFLHNLLVAPAMILACTRMVQGKAASPAMDEDEKRYKLVENIFQEVKTDKEITAAQCKKIACAMGCKLDGDAQGVLVKALLGGEDDPFDGIDMSPELTAGVVTFFVRTFKDQTDGGDNLLCEMMFVHMCAWLVWTAQLDILKLKDEGVRKSTIDILFNEYANVLPIMEDTIPKNFHGTFSDGRISVSKVILEPVCLMLLAHIASRPEFKDNADVDAAWKRVVKSIDLEKSLQEFIQAIGKAVADTAAPVTAAAAAIGSGGGKSKLKKVQAKLLS